MSSLKAVPSDRKALKQLFHENDGSVSTSNLLASIAQLSTHTSGFAERAQSYSHQAYGPTPAVAAITTAEIPTRSNSQRIKLRHAFSTHLPKSITNQTTTTAIEDIRSPTSTHAIVTSSATNIPSTEQVAAITVDATKNQLNQSSLLDIVSQYASLPIPKPKERKDSRSLLSFSSTFKVNSSNPDEFKGIRLPRPKNVRNELNLRSIFNPDTTLSASTLDTTQEPHKLTMKKTQQVDAQTALVEKIKNNNIGYHHLQAMEKIFGELDPSTSGFVDKQQFKTMVRKRMGKVVTDGLLIEMIEAVVDERGTHIDSIKLSRLLDAFKFAPRLVDPYENNNSENYRRKMLDDKDISVDKLSNAHELYIMLIEKLEEKFEKFQRVFFFFDPEQGGRVFYTQFKQTLDKLCLRFRDEEAKELFNFLDKKQDGYLDYEEMCSLVPNRLELEMLERNGESLFDRTQQIYERFGDLQNYSQDPHRNYERARYHSNSFQDEMAEQIGKDIFYSDKLKNAIHSNVVLRFGRTQPGETMRFGYNIPSDVDQSHAYGLKPKKGENMYDILGNNYAKEWTIDAEKRQQRAQSLSSNFKLKKRPKNTFANMMRSLHNSTRNHRDETSQPSGQQRRMGGSYSGNSLNQDVGSMKSPKFRSTSFQFKDKQDGKSATHLLRHSMNDNDSGMYSSGEKVNQVRYQGDRGSLNRTSTCF